MSVFLAFVDSFKLDKFRAVNNRYMKCYYYAISAIISIIIIIMQANINFFNAKNSYKCVFFKLFFMVPSFWNLFKLFWFHHFGPFLKMFWCHHCATFLNGFGSIIVEPF